MCHHFNLQLIISSSIINHYQQCSNHLLEEEATITTSPPHTNGIVESSSSNNNNESPLSEFDPEISNLINLENKRQQHGLELIASENFVSQSVKQVLGSCLTNKYSEGQVGKRYYGGNEYIDKIESLCMKRALKLYNLDTNTWGVNVQPYSGSPANFAVYTALLNPHDRIMGLDLPSGGAFNTWVSNCKEESKRYICYFESCPYIVDSSTGLVDYNDMEYRAKMFMPKLLNSGWISIHKRMGVSTHERNC